METPLSRIHLSKVPHRCAGGKSQFLARKKRIKFGHSGDGLFTTPWLDCGELSGYPQRQRDFTMHGLTSTFRLTRTALLAGVFGLALMGPAAAQDSPDPGIEFEAGGGISVEPAYEGSSSYVFSPWPIVRLKRLTLPGGFTIGGKDGGFSVKPSFRLLSKRSDTDHPALLGLGTVKDALEVGLGFSYTAQYWSVFAQARRGITGHEGVVGEAGADVILRPMDGLKVTAGPRLSFASADYMATYFGVTPAQSAASGLAQHVAGSGIKSAGAEIGFRYDMDVDWALEGAASYSRMTGDAANSPITKAGSRDQFGMRIGIVRSIELGF